MGGNRHVCTGGKGGRRNMYVVSSTVYLSSALARLPRAGPALARVVNIYF